MSVDAVVFDIGRVLIEWSPERFYDRVIGPERRQALFAEVDLMEMNDAIDRGADFRETVYRCADRHAHWRDEIRMWHDNWLEMASPEIPHSVRLLRALRARGVPVFALTNFGVGTFAVASAAYPFFAEFDRAFVSGHLEVMKPEPRIYEILEQETGLAPDRLIFTDDKEENVAMARARGWKTHLFTGPQGWADTLVAAGLLTEKEAT
ncbi:HAD family hydrolase [Pseudoponticoccus marisrubri]|uniref:Haloacid dehalogenase n=1 Tax=Pseudoponticoccus marisrubri TaxID=1685382 RepID=A0A0W7WHT1_9RHOB|nr:HAD family phosphatase [Pseudoponticoccus marisrubri]KUF10137.1 haloacid dehalogenase [Pseudoponticoccus marisrubri]